MSLTLLHKMQINQKSLLVILYFHLEWVFSVNLVHIALEKKSKLTSNYGDFIRAAVLYHWHHKWLFVIAFGRIMSLWRTITTTFYHRMDWVELDLLTKDVTFDPKCYFCNYVILLSSFHKTFIVTVFCRNSTFFIIKNQRVSKNGRNH